MRGLDVRTFSERDLLQVRRWCRLLAATFHPELSGYDGIHRYFHSMVQEGGAWAR